ncbi:MAG: hypothetical protein K5657_07895 [Desulfovibrio sp.]|nr:hypothetical protein [Desulfovibrio sp.]
MLLNYNSSLLSPTKVGRNGTAVTKPCGMASTDKSSDPVPTPGDAEYLAPSDGAADTTHVHFFVITPEYAKSG